MSATETIIAFAAKQALDKAIGGATPIVTAYHKTHFILLARAIQESNRDQDIQKTLQAIQKNLTDMKNYGTRLLKAIPPKPEPPSADAAELLAPATGKEFFKLAGEFTKGVENILDTLGNYVKTADDLLNRTAGELAKVEKNLNMKGAKWAALRQISNAQRLQDIQFIKIDEMDKLSKQVSAAKSLIAAYSNF
jgi:hypothetical protein